MSTPDVLIIRTGSANLASIAAAFARLGVRTRTTEDANEVAMSPLVVLPGVGAFGPAMARLRELGLDRAVLDRIERGRPLLAICLGMQLLCEASEESPGVAGLGVVPGHVRRYGGTVRVPQMGWNQIAPTPAATVLQPGCMYFANSFRLDGIPNGWAGAETAYDGPFCSALERGPLLACQFHPELSGASGLLLLRRWLAAATSREPVPC